jgi:hypothetical protein
MYCIVFAVLLKLKQAAFAFTEQFALAVGAVCISVSTLRSMALLMDCRLMDGGWRLGWGRAHFLFPF